MDLSEAEDEAAFKLATGDEYMDFAEIDSEETFAGHSLVTGDGVM
jgi:hypothetical protein